MHAIVITGPGTVELAERPKPIPGAEQLLVAVRASGLNRADLLQVAGKYPAPPGWPADIPGLEYAGEVTHIGRGVTRFAVGDRVMGLVGGGAHAEYVVVHQDEVMRIPDGLTFEDAAAIPEAFLTAWDALVLRGHVVPGERVLFHAVGSGVGTAAVQLAPILEVTMIGTSRTADKLERCRALGMTHGVLTTDSGWMQQAGGPVDVIVDTLGAQFLGQNLDLLAPLGRLVILGTLTGGVAEQFNMSLVLRKRLTLVGTAMRARSLEERRVLVMQFTSDVLPHFASGILKPIVDRVVPITEFAAAMAAMNKNETFGKIVLTR